MKPALPRFFARRKSAAAAPSVSRTILPAGTPVPLPAEITRSLHAVAARHFRVSLAECAAVLLTVLPALAVLQATADWWFNLSWTVRLIFLLADLSVAGWVVFRFAWQPLRRRMTPEIAALRVEAELPQFRTALISAVELSRGGPGCTQGSPDLLQELLRQVRERVRNFPTAQRVVKTVRLRRWARWMLVSLVVAGTLGAVFWPRSRVLLQRILLSSEPLPTRTVVEPITAHLATVVGADVKLSARAVGVVPRSGVVRVTYANKDRQDIAVTPSAEDPAIFEVTLRNVQQPFSYQFALNDGVGPVFSVDARTAPVLETVRILQTYPAYTKMRESEMPVGNLTLLAGSRVRIEGRATQPLRSARLLLEGVNTAQDGVVGKADERAFQGEFVVPREGLTGLSVELTNTDGVVSQDNTVYRVELIPDRPPTLEWLAPAADRLSVVRSSKPRLGYTVRDDFGVKKLFLKFELARPTPPGGGDPVTETGSVPLDATADGGTRNFVWDLAGQKPGITEGTTVTYWIEAEDNNDVTGPGVGQTSRKTLVVLTPAQKQAELLEILGARAAEIDEISETQKKVNEDLDRSLRKNQP